MLWLCAGCFILDPRGTSIFLVPVSKKLLQIAGIDDYYISARDCSATLGNFAKAFDAISTYTAIWSMISGKTLYSQTLPIKNSLTSLYSPKPKCAEDSGYNMELLYKKI